MCNLGKPSIFKNLEQLLSTANKDVRRDVLQVLEAAVFSVDPYRCVMDYLRLEDGDWLVVGDKRFFLGGYENIFVVGGGKAAHSMAKAVVDVLGDRVCGWLNGSVDTKMGGVTCVQAGHPIPDPRGEEGAKKILEIVEGAGEKDLVLCLLSGGGSAMMPLPEKGLSLGDKVETTKLLLACGANINEINAVRKHLSRVKGGKLARAAYPATVVGLILSDVIGDPLDGIASGPTAPDTTTFEDATKVLEKYNILSKVPKTVRRFLEEKRGETPKPGDKVFERVYNVVVGNNEKALDGAERKARELGYNTVVLTAYLDGEAREAPEKLFGLVRGVKLGRGPVRKPAMIIAGGETTV
ncbi:MAG: glycerate kinase, partial [Methanobacteriota archaeon]